MVWGSNLAPVMSLIGPQPMVQIYMWSPRFTLIPMVLGDTMLRSRYLMKSGSDFTKITYPNMGYSNTMGFRVTMGNHMYRWAMG